MPRIFLNQDLTPEVLAGLGQDDKDWIYNALDVCLTFEIHDRQMESIDEVARNTARFSRTLACPVLEMNMRGVLIDLDQRDRSLVELRSVRDRVEHNLNRLVVEGVGYWASFNWRSHIQLKDLFYRVLRLKPVMKRNTAGAYTPSVDREALEKLSAYYSAQLLCTHVIALRELDKKIDVFEKELDEDGRLRTSFNIAGTNTGRLSSSASDWGTGGNQQNIERALRSIFVADPGMKLCNIDIEQGDSRNVGAICWELFVESHGEAWAGAYLDACESGDLHTTVCRMGWPELDWPEEPWLQRAVANQIAYRTFSYRDMSKKLGHGTNYYGTPRTMAGHTKVEIRQVESFQRRYFGAFPCLGSYSRDASLVNWHNWVRRQVTQLGYVTTPYFNRRRYFFGRPDDDRTLREAIAFAPQSMTADEIDEIIIRLWKWGRVQILLQVHDSLLFQFPAELEAELVPTALKIAQLTIPLKRDRDFTVGLEAKVGFNWADVEYWTKADVATGLCSVEQVGQVKANPFGLIKWPGPGIDTRRRPDYRSGPQRAPTLADLLHAP